MSGKQRNLRKRRALDKQEELSDDGDAAPAAAAAAGGEGGEPAAPRLTAEDIRALQKQRQRRTGVDAAALMAAAEVRERKGSGLTVGGPSAHQDVLQAAFKRERQLHSEEEDPHMKKYIEEQLAKRMGRHLEDEAARAAAEEAARRAADPLLAALPEGLQKRQQDTELGPSWVAGITEVPLSLEQKLKNIEDTERAKKEMLLMGGAYDDDDDMAGPGGTRRGAFPVTFGKQNPKHLQVIAEAQAKKARMRERQEEKKRKKKEEFAGW
ncbi:hypothetical protein ABPG75_000634 [Micractinium tetrahymenae]